MSQTTLDDILVPNIIALIDLYHNEQLLTNEEGAHFQGPFGNWRKAIVKDSYTAGKICNILRKYKYYEEQMMIQGNEACDVCIGEKVCVSVNGCVTKYMSGCVSF